MGAPGPTQVARRALRENPVEMLGFFPGAKVAGCLKMPVDRDLGNRLGVLGHLSNVPDDRPQPDSKVDLLDAPHDALRQLPLNLFVAGHPFDAIVRLFQITLHQGVERVLNQQPNLIAIVEDALRKLRIHTLHITLQPQRLLSNMRGEIAHLFQTLRDNPVTDNVQWPVDTDLFRHATVQDSEKQLSNDHPVDAIRFLLHVQNLVCKIWPSFHNRLHSGLQHRAENNLQAPHQPVDRELRRINKALQRNGLQTLLHDPQPSQPPANRPDLFQVTLGELFLRDNLDSIMTRQIVRGDDPSEKVGRITNVRVNNIPEVLPFT